MVLTYFFGGKHVLCHVMSHDAPSELVTDEQKASLNYHLQDISKHIAIATRVSTAADQAVANGKVKVDLMLHNLGTLKCAGEEAEEVGMMWP